MNFNYLYDTANRFVSRISPGGTAHVNDQPFGALPTVTFTGEGYAFGLTNAKLQ